jgi:hypothetical protein
LHVLLWAAAATIGVPWPWRVLAALAVLGHALARRPAVPPATLAVGADGSWHLPEVGRGGFMVGPGTRLAAHWIRVDLRAGAERLDILLLVDQLDREDWARLSARLRRTAAPRARAALNGPGAREPDLR